MAAAIGQDYVSRDGGMGVQLAADFQQVDHGMCILHKLAQHGLRIVFFDVKQCEPFACTGYNLLCGHGAATAPAHAVGNHNHEAVFFVRVLQDFNLVLLVCAIALVGGGGDGQTVVGNVHRGFLCAMTPIKASLPRAWLIGADSFALGPKMGICFLTL